VNGLAPVGQEGVETLVGEWGVKDLFQKAERHPGHVRANSLARSRRVKFAHRGEQNLGWAVVVGKNLHHLLDYLKAIRPDFIQCVRRTVTSRAAFARRQGLQRREVIGWQPPV
jgi:hypothetical protein